MQNQQKSDNELAPVVSKLINIIVILLVFILALILLLVVLVPKSAPKVEQKIEVPVPDKYGNFTNAAKQEAIRQSFGSAGENKVSSPNFAPATDQKNNQ